MPKPYRPNKKKKKVVSEDKLPVYIYNAQNHLELGDKLKACRAIADGAGVGMITAKHLIDAVYIRKTYYWVDAINTVLNGK